METIEVEVSKFSPNAFGVVMKVGNKDADFVRKFSVYPKDQAGFLKVDLNYFFSKILAKGYTLKCPPDNNCASLYEKYPIFTTEQEARQYIEDVIEPLLVMNELT